MASEILYEKIEGSIALVTLNRPDKRNAVNGALAEGLDAAVKRSEADAEIQAVVLRSSNDRVFCAGADLAAIAAGQGARVETPDGGFAGLCHARRSKPWIAAVCGSALGGGLELSLACDMIVAGTGARFGLPETQRGLLAAAGGTTRLARAIPRVVAIEMITTGEPIDAQRAYALGLVNRVVAVNQVLSEALAIARRIAVNAPLAVREALVLARDGDQMSDKQARTRTDEAVARLRLTEDWKEGPRAYVQKRAPVWKGR